MRSKLSDNARQLFLLEILKLEICEVAIRYYSPAPMSDN